MRRATREEQNAYLKEWHARNPGRQKQYYEKWQASHVKQERERQRLKYQRTKEACAVRYKARYEKKKTEILQMGKASYKKNRDKVLRRTWQWRLLNDFGLTVDQYNAMHEKQGGVCAICKKECRRRLGVDHCHATGKVRGLLCHSCNIALGLLKDSIASAEAVVTYLRAAQ